MVDPTLFLKLNVLGKLLRADPRPFGGLQLVVSGDFFQLPPVNRSRILELECLRCGKCSLEEVPPGPGPPVEGHTRVRCVRTQNQEGVTVDGCGFQWTLLAFAFETDTWKECKFKVVELTKVFRQRDAEMVEVLQQIRRGRCDEAALDFFARCGTGLATQIKIKPTKLYPQNRNVETENLQEFRKLPGQQVDYLAQDSVEKDYASKVDELPPSARFEAKVDAQVMLLVNLDPSRHLVNGSRGVIIGFVPSSSQEPATDEFLQKQRHDLLPVVLFAANGGTQVTLEPQTWSESLGSDLGRLYRTQMPLQLAWALTIHKAQGQSLDAVTMDLSGTFAHGQAYVALSRCRTMEGMRVTGFSPSKIITDSTCSAEDAVLKTNPLDHLPRSHELRIGLRHIFETPGSTPTPRMDRSEPSQSAPVRTSPARSRPNDTTTSPVEARSTRTPRPATGLAANKDFQDSLYEAAVAYITAQEDVGASGGTSIVDENGFIEAARHLFARARRDCVPSGTSTAPTSEKRRSEEPHTSMEKPSKRSRSQFSPESIEAGQVYIPDGIAGRSLATTPLRAQRAADLDAPTTNRAETVEGDPEGEMSLSS
ncbi:hypothetical protein JCM11491_000753 [Sporobolomyces phaffii]